MKFQVAARKEKCCFELGFYLFLHCIYFSVSSYLSGWILSNCCLVSRGTKWQKIICVDGFVFLLKNQKNWRLLMDASWCRWFVLIVDVEVKWIVSGKSWTECILYMYTYMYCISMCMVYVLCMYKYCIGICIVYMYWVGINNVVYMYLCRK